MSGSAASRAGEPPPGGMAATPAEGGSRRIPRVRLQAFAATAATGAALTALASDRRLAGAAVEVAEGGLDAAVARCVAEPGADLIFVESTAAAEAMPLELDRLAEACAPGARVVVIGHANDIALYRRLIEAGVEDYLVAPVETAALVGVVERVFCGEAAKRLGRVHAFIGAKGGAGSSVLAQNVSWAMSERGRETLLIDLDLELGVAALNCDLEAGRGVAEALRETARLDAALLERLAVRRGRSLSVLGAAAALEEGEEPDAAAIERLIDVAEREFPHVVLDLPRRWSPWVRAALRRADDVVLTAQPSLAALRNAAAILDALRALRPNDPPPRLVLNQTGAGAPEPAAREVEATLKLEPSHRFAFEPKLFGAAAASGAMLSETRKGGAARREIEALAAALAGEASAPARRTLRLPTWKPLRRRAAAGSR